MIFIASTTAHPYVTFTSMSLSPLPVVVPGDITVGIQGTIHRHFGNDSNLYVSLLVNKTTALGFSVGIPCLEMLKPFGSW